jgi:hypothetical protein
MFVLFFLGIVFFGPFLLAAILFGCGIVISYALAIFAFVVGLIVPILKWVYKLIWRIFNPFKGRTR